MSRSRRRHRVAAVRLVVFAILALALLLRPTLSSLAEVHEFAHDPSGQHLDLESAAAQGTDDEGGGQREGQTGDALHTLVHFAHCCGQASDLPPYGPLAAGPVTAVPFAMTERAAVSIARWQTPFRPPIQAA